MKSKLLLILDTELKDKVANIAMRKLMSRSQYIRLAIQDAVDCDEIMDKPSGGDAHGGNDNRKERLQSILQKREPEQEEV